MPQGVVVGVTLRATFVRLRPAQFDLGQPEAEVIEPAGEEVADRDLT
jgi:hypothetical protein